VVVLFVILVPALIRLNREYQMESEVLAAITGAQPPPRPHYTGRTVFVFVDSMDLATLAALRYARSLRPTSLRAVHFVIDNVRAEKLRADWTRANRGVVLDFIDVPDRRLTRAAAPAVGAQRSPGPPGQPGPHRSQCPAVTAPAGARTSRARQRPGPRARKFPPIRR
jgi:hypothetical protein